MTKVSARQLVIKDNKVLLMFRNKHGKIYFSIPGGKKENQDATTEETANREVYEETSVTTKLVKLLGQFKDFDKDKLQYVYLGEFISGTPKLTNNTEMQKMLKEPDNFYLPMWVNINSALEQKLMPKCVESFVKKFLAELID